MSHRSFPRPSPAKRVPVLVLACILAGCGGVGKSAWQRVAGDGVSFEAPVGWTVSAAAGAVTARSGPVDLVEVVRFRLERPYRRSRLAAAARELDSLAVRLARALHGRLVHRQTTTVGGLDARSYRIDYPGKTQEITFALRGLDEYELVCRRPSGADARPGSVRAEERGGLAREPLARRLRAAAGTGELRRELGHLAELVRPALRDRDPPRLAEEEERERRVAAGERGPRLGELAAVRRPGLSARRGGPGCAPARAQAPVGGPGLGRRRVVEPGAAEVDEDRDRDPGDDRERHAAGARERERGRRGPEEEREDDAPEDRRRALRVVAAEEGEPHEQVEHPHRPPPFAACRSTGRGPPRARRRRAPANAAANTSSIVSTRTKVSASRVSGGRSARSGSFSRGRITRRRPARCAASAFSRTPPIGSTWPVRVISPVMPTSSATGSPRTREARAVAIVTPADGPSLGTAPAGTWMWTSCVVNQLSSTPSSPACERTHESAARADSCITSPSCPVTVRFPLPG